MNLRSIKAYSRQKGNIRLSIVAENDTINYFMMNFKATDEMEMDKYKKELAAWEKEKFRQKYEFCITENDLDADKRIYDDVEIEFGDGGDDNVNSTGGESGFAIVSNGNNVTITGGNNEINIKGRRS